MIQFLSLRASVQWSLLAGITCLTWACSSSSGSSSTRTEADFAVDDLSVGAGSTWKLNRPIDIHFNRAVDFDSVNSNTIYVATIDGTPATGTFALVDKQTVRFQPACPTLADNSDAGFQPGGVTYRLQVLGSGSGGGTVLDENGEALEDGISVAFVTPDSNDPQALFIDSVSGPPAPRIRGRSGVPVDALDSTYVELGGAADEREYFVWDAVNQVGEPQNEAFRLPLNLYSEPELAVAFILALNQPVNPSEENLSSNFVQLEYQDDAGDWQPIATTVSLERNCTEAGSLLRLVPVGLLPQATDIRVIIREGFADLVGDKTLLDNTGFAGLTSLSPDHLPGDDMDSPAPSADELLERFASAALEDREAASALPHADWGGGVLRASFPFGGTGGPNGNFDWYLQPGDEFILDTTSALITGGPGGDPTTTQVVINGIVDARNLFIAAGATLIIQGPNPCQILLTGSAIIEGVIIVDGSSNRGVSTLNTTNIPEPGASGNAGGGRGGIGSYLTQQSTPRGGRGEGPFNVPNLGGDGGESSYAGGNDVGARRAAGGGGGVFGADVYYLFDENPSELVRCQELIGLDGEAGFGGGIDPGKGAVSQAERAQGGSLGQSPFTDEDANNDFLGTMLTADGALIQGELDRLWAGAGGGAGGDAVDSDAFPLVPFLATGDEKGAGGGGGAGGFAIQAIGGIEIRQPTGAIRANGGQGGGGENTSGFNRVGGGSGGGSGGHLVLSSASFVSIEGSVDGAGDWYNDDSNTGHGQRVISVLGGQGGAGHNNKGGSKQNGEQVTWRCDAIPLSAFLQSDPRNPPLADSSCWTAVNMPDQDDPLGPCLGAGGDGSPGIFQVHVADPDQNFLFPDIAGIYGAAGVGGTDVSKACAPPPLGWKAPELNVASDRMVPFYGQQSVSRSLWIPLGLARVKAGAGEGIVSFFFGGTDTDDGSVLRADAEQSTLPALIGPVDLQTEPNLPYVDSQNPLTIVLDAAALAGTDLFYKRNPTLLRLFQVHLEDQFDEENIQEHSVESAIYDPDSDSFRIVVGTSAGKTLADFESSGSTLVSLLPYFFRVNTGGSPLIYPADSEIRITFEGTVGNAEGNPDEGATSGALTNIEDLNLADYEFFRFQVEFDLSTSGQPVDQDTPRPGLEFLRIPFRMTTP